MEKNIYINRIKIKRQWMHIYIKSQLNISSLTATIEFQNNHLNLVHPVELRLVNGTLECIVDVSSLEADDGDWSIIIRDNESDTIYLPILDSRVRLSLILGRHYVQKNEFVYFPMGVSEYHLAIRARRWQDYDSMSFRIREMGAFALYKAFGKIFKKKNIWLIYEKYCLSAQENGFYFFEYCMKKNLKNVYFILDKKSPQWDEAQKYSSNIIPAKSFKHIFYLLIARLYVSPDGRHHAYVWKPMPNPVTRELNKKKLYFLQHGVLALKNVDSLFGINASSSVTYFTASSEFEKSIIVNNMGYAPENVPVTRLARWDKVNDTSDRANPVILVMPTWRSWLEGQNDEYFRKSSYYKHYSSLLSNKELQNFLKENNTKLVFYIHPKLKEFIGAFDIDDSNVEIFSFDSIPLNRLLMRCSMMITDYSSACWDVYYQGKPILFYQFDIDEYNETNGSYIDMDTELWGDKCDNEEDLVKSIRKYVADGFREKEKYAAMRKDYFAYIDHNNCERIYNNIKSRGF